MLDPADPRPIVAVDWAAHRIHVTFDGATVHQLPDLPALLADLHTPHRIVTESTLESFDPATRAARVAAARAAGHEVYVYRPLHTARRRVELGWDKYDAVDARVIYHIATVGDLHLYPLGDHDPAWAARPDPSTPTTAGPTWASGASRSEPAGRGRRRRTRPPPRPVRPGRSPRRPRVPVCGPNGAPDRQPHHSREPHVTVTFDDYQDRCAATAVYPRKGTGDLLALAYTALGLGEVGEVHGQLLTHAPGPERDREVICELGDVLWFTAQTATELGYRLSDITTGRRDAGPVVMDDLPAPARDLPTAVADLSAAVGEVQGRISKILRGDPATTTPAYRARIAAGLTAVLTAAASTAHAAGSTLAQVAQANLDKLADRAARGVLKGAGDHR